MGASGDEQLGWGKMRVQTNYKMVKQLTAVRSRDIAPAAMNGVIAQLKNVKEEDVKQESLAALALWKWLAQVIAVRVCVHVLCVDVRVCVSVISASASTSVRMLMCVCMGMYLCPGN